MRLDWTKYGNFKRMLSNVTVVAGFSKYMLKVKQHYLNGYCQCSRYQYEYWGRQVVKFLGAVYNLVAMDWLDFEKQDMKYLTLLKARKNNILYNPITKSSTPSNYSTLIFFAAISP